MNRRGFVTGLGSLAAAGAAAQALRALVRVRNIRGGNANGIPPVSAVQCEQQSGRYQSDEQSRPAAA